MSDDVSEEDMAPVVDKIKGMGKEVLSLRCDVRDKSSVGQAVKRAAEHFGGLHIMVANAGALQLASCKVCGPAGCATLSPKI